MQMKYLKIMQDNSKPNADCWAHVHISEQRFKWEASKQIYTQAMNKHLTRGTLNSSLSADCGTHVHISEHINIRKASKQIKKYFSLNRIQDTSKPNADCWAHVHISEQRIKKEGK